MPSGYGAPREASERRARVVRSECGRRVCVYRERSHVRACRQRSLYPRVEPLTKRVVLFPHWAPHQSAHTARRCSGQIRVR